MDQSNAKLSMDVDTSRAPLSPARFGAMLVALGESIDTEDQLAELLQRAVDTALNVIPGADSCGITVDFGGQTYTAARSGPLTLAMDNNQYELDDGPSLYAARRGELVLVDCDRGDPRWPPFFEVARNAGVRAFLAAPVTAAERNLGALNLYGTSAAAFDEVDKEMLDILTSTVGRAISEFARFKSADKVATGLRTAIETRAPIEQAKGILMALRQIDAEAAFEVLSLESQKSNKKVRDIALDFVKKSSTPAPEPGVPHDPSA